MLKRSSITVLSIVAGTLLTAWVAMRPVLVARRGTG